MDYRKNACGVDCGASSTRFGSLGGEVHVIPNNMKMLEMGDIVKLEPFGPEVEQCLEVIITRNEPCENGFLPAHVLIGQLASRASSTNERPSIDIPKHKQRVNIVSIITGVALAKHLNGLGDTLKLYLALPPAETRGSSDDVAATLVGTYHVTFPKLNGGISVDFIIDEVECQAESSMASTSFFIDRSLKIREQSKKLITGKALSVNIGASTTDLAIIENGKYMEMSGVTYKIGGNIIRDVVGQMILEKFGFEPSISQLERVVVEGRVQIGAQFMDICDIMEAAKKDFADRLIQQMNTYFKSKDTNIQSFTGIIPSGGGSLESFYFDENGERHKTSDSISLYMTESLKKICPYVIVADYKDTGEDPRLADILGLITKIAADELKQYRSNPQSQVKAPAPTPAPAPAPAPVQNVSETPQVQEQSVTAPVQGTVSQ